MPHSSLVREPAYSGRTVVCCLLIVALSVVHARGADASRPHPHNGELAKYQSQAPSKYGLSVDNVPLEKLRSGKPVLRMTTVAGGFKRSVSIQDVNAPPSVVWGRIMDLQKYPKMVEGCVECEPYRTEKKAGGTQVVYARYKIRAAGLAMEYFMKHIYEPRNHCMTFHLDYERLSELSDTVGYWYVEKLDDGWCRVYYSTDSKVPGWVPGFMKDQIVNLAAKRSTSWVDVECKKALGISVGPKGGCRRLGLPIKLIARAAVVGYLLRRLARLYPEFDIELRSPIIMRIGAAKAESRE